METRSGAATTVGTYEWWRWRTLSARNREPHQHVGIKWIIYLMRCCICHNSLGTFLCAFAFVNAHDRESNYLDVCISFCNPLIKSIQFAIFRWKLLAHCHTFPAANQNDCPNISSILIPSIQNPAKKMKWKTSNDDYDSIWICLVCALCGSISTDKSLYTKIPENKICRMH